MEMAQVLNTGVFWDGENVRIPPGTNATHAGNRIRAVLQARLPAVSLSTKNYYYDARNPCEVNVQRARLDTAGFNMVDCPKRGRKESLDKRIIVDTMRFAMQSLADQKQTAVVLVTGDGDFAHMLHTLRDFNVTVVVIIPREAAAVCLIDAADHTLRWVDDILAPMTSDVPEDSASLDQDPRTADVPEDNASLEHDPSVFLTCVRDNQKLADDWAFCGDCVCMYGKKTGLRGTTRRNEFNTMMQSTMAAGFLEAGFGPIGEMEVWEPSTEMPSVTTRDFSPGNQSRRVVITGFRLTQNGRTKLIGED